MAKSNRPEIARREAEYQSASNANCYRFPDKPFPHTMLLVFKEYSYDNFKNGKYAQSIQTGFDTNEFGGRRTSGQGLRIQGASLKSMYSVELPFPKQLQDSSTLQINGFSRDPLIEGLTNQLQNFASGSNATLGDIPGMIQGAGAKIAQALASGSSGGLANAINEVASGIAATGIADTATAAQYLLRKFVPGDLGKSINLATGQVLNPRETLAFEGVGLRTHQFSWDLYPSNKNDSARIKEIVEIIKRCILPTVQDIGSGQASISQAFLRYPYTVDIHLIGVAPGYFMKFKPALVTNFTVDYGAGGGVAMMKGGKPAGVSLSLSLQELQIETAHDYGAESIDAQPAIPLDQGQVQVGYGEGQVDPGIARLIRT